MEGDSLDARPSVAHLQLAADRRARSAQRLNEEAEETRARHPSADDEDGDHAKLEETDVPGPRCVVHRGEERIAAHLRHETGREAIDEEAEAEEHGPMDGARAPDRAGHARFRSSSAPFSKSQTSEV